MSLINQMLQELDARRSDTASGNPFGQQVRAVPVRGRNLQFWLGVAAVATGAAGILGWALMRPAETTIATVTPPAQLPLKLDADLSIERPPATQEASAPTNTVEAASPAPAERPVEKVAPVAPADNTPALQALAPPPVSAAAADALSANTRVSAQVRTVKETPPAPAPEIAKVIPPAKSLTAAPAGKQQETSALPVTINKQINQLSPQQRAENEFRKAIQAVRQGKASEAISGLELSLQLDPYHAAARQALIGVLLDGNRQDDALRYAREGLQLDSSLYGFAMVVARLQVERGELRPAIETLERTLPYATDRPDYTAFLAVLLQRDGKHKQAAEHFLQALQRMPQNGVWWMGLGISFQAEHRTSEAVEAFKRAKATNALSPELQTFVDGRLAQLQPR